jgi:hypothetical protein
MSRTFSIRNKYRITAAMLSDAAGTLLDVGARDRVLAGVLPGNRIRYFSADVSSGCDYVIDLEAPLTFEDRQFDFVVALDVLEHVEHIHAAFRELARIAGVGLVVALPNMSALASRIAFLARGRMATRKYDLAPVHQGDRHRWLTVYDQMNAFIAAAASEAGFTLHQACDEADGTSVRRAFSYAAGKVGLWPGLWSGRTVYYLRRTGTASSRV